MSNHTPGPWKMRRRDGIDDGDNFLLGWDWDWEYGGNPPEPDRGVVAKEADARLIAAAPKLLAALKEMVVAYDEDSREVREAKAAIAKAEGRHADAE